MFVSASKLITPNNDLINETFQIKIRNIETLATYNTDGTYMISDKCNLLFESQSLNEEWDGQVEIDGIYNAKIEFNSLNQEITIDFTFEVQKNLIPE